MNIQTKKVLLICLAHFSKNVNRKTLYERLCTVFGTELLLKFNRYGTIFKNYKVNYDRQRGSKKTAHRADYASA